MMKKDLSWKAILYDYSQRLLKFLINAQSNTLPSPDNLKRWSLNKNILCGRLRYLTFWLDVAGFVTQRTS